MATQSIIEKIWTLRVTGRVTRLRADGARVAVPEGKYVMMEAHRQYYEIAREGGASFILSLIEISSYVLERQIEIDGIWP